ncbi:ArgS-related anticodon-binding protein NrtL [Streptomyces mexicanus]|uniref:ArgS-related anticodon-binding protein NrtL n=1 Tax=Streptomyces mexicanus TaxID=178566 RepID=UPI0031E86E61
MTPVELSRTVLRAVRRAVDGGELCVSVPERAVVAPPGPGGCGDYATTIALRLARPAGQPPLRVAEVLRSHLLALDGIRDVVVTGPGFLNISLEDGQAEGGSVRLVEDVLRDGVRYGYGHGYGGHGFASSDTACHGTAQAEPVLLRCPADLRALVVADAVARLLRSQGARVRVVRAGPVPREWGELFGVRGVGLDHVDGFDGFVDGLDGFDGSHSSEVPEGGAATVFVRPVPAPVPAADVLALGRDAGRWALLHPAGHDRPRIGAEHLVQRESNPLFRVRYAHARTRALHRNAADLGFAPEPGATHVPAVARPLLATLADHPRVLARAAAHRAPDRLARHLVTVADAVLPLLPAVLPLGEEKPSAAHRARLALAEAAGTVLAGGLSLLGIDAPDHL